MIGSASNAPELTVTELSGALKRTLEDAFGQVRLRGEVSGYRGPHASGHVYFTIKDANARIDAVIWKGVFSKIKFRPEEGMEVIAIGRVTTFPGKSSYQILIEQIEPAGIGALMALLEARRAVFAAEGLFDLARKKRFPFLPRIIGIITSPNGAVIRDIIHRLSDRFPRHVLLWPVKVQGEGSAAEISAALDGFNAFSQGDAEFPRPDVILVARGGGSLEDLWGFNEEIVIRAAARSMIPIISAIGHETDWTLLDHVADLRAPTPSAAAEMVVPVRVELLAATHQCGIRVKAAILRFMERSRREYVHLLQRYPSSDRMLEIPRQRFDRAYSRFMGEKRGALDRRWLALNPLLRRLHAQTPETRLARMTEKLVGLGLRLSGLTKRRLRDAERMLFQGRGQLSRAMAMRCLLEKKTLVNNRVTLGSFSKRLATAWSIRVRRLKEIWRARSDLLDSLSYHRVLARGYTVVRDKKGSILPKALGIDRGAMLDIEFSDGHIFVEKTASDTIKKGSISSSSLSRKSKNKSIRKNEQGNLF